MFDPASLFSEHTSTPPPQPDSLRPLIADCYDVDETAWIRALIDIAQPSPARMDAVTRRATALIEAVRRQDDSIHVVDALLQEYSLDTQEGILLMCLAEALMRIPDKSTADALIQDRLSVADWKKHMGKSDSALVNASTWGLLLTGKVIRLDEKISGNPASILKRLVHKSGEPVIRKAIYQAMKIMGRQFVLGRTIEEALDNGRKVRQAGYRYSFDMLGEAAMTAADARRYLADYLKAIRAVGADLQRLQDPQASSVSIKLSALHPRYESLQKDRVVRELGDTLRQLLGEARALGVAITIDAEEMDRLELSLDLFALLYRDPVVRGWGGFGLVVQAYSKRALPVLHWLVALAADQGDQIPVRLVKGAYWDSEIKLAQQRGLPAYPVYTRKESTDVAYLACARYLFQEQTRGRIYPQFATHNAHTVASVLEIASGRDRPYEFQRLHGMGDALYKVVLEQVQVPVRIYAPVGAHKDLLPYLVRRLLENGANSSFVHRLVDADTPVEDLVRHPAMVLQKYRTLPNPRIPLPEAIYPDRRNSSGLNLAVEKHRAMFQERIEPWMTREWFARPSVGSNSTGTAAVTCDGSGPVRENGSAELAQFGQGAVDSAVRSAVEGRPLRSEQLVGDIERRRTVCAPYDRSERVGFALWSTSADIELALTTAAGEIPAWRATRVDRRAAMLDRFAELLERHQGELISLCMREAGKTAQDCIDEVREAVDFARYYAREAMRLMGKPTRLPGPTGESNELYLEGKGLFVCISPWNFPLAIFTGQVTAALAAGNTVIAKPAEQTTLIAAFAIELLHTAGIPRAALQLLPGDGAQMGPGLLSDHRVDGVAFTGSTQAALQINRTLAARSGAIATLIAETGGQNAMIVDSTALPEQVVRDVLQAAFASAGQRCSALRVLFVQEEIADSLLELLAGAMQELRVGDPRSLATDLGPVIDSDAKDSLQQHLRWLKEKGAGFRQTATADPLQEKGSFIRPSVAEIDSLAQLEHEHFGPVLHVIRYAARALDSVIDAINNTGYGLTLGIHSRNESTARHIERRVKVGNAYINRNQIGAVVGVQPFGGHGLSGTGPKAGGPHYLLRFVNERTRTINTTAVGGNASLLSLGEEQLDA